MNVASLDLCRELYELSGWDYTEFHHRRYSPISQGDDWWVSHRTEASTASMEMLPGYDLGYLLRKLPRPTAIYSDWPDELYSAEYQHGDHLDDERMHVHGMQTPEDAACKLAIELIKQGILTKVGDET